MAGEALGSCVWQKEVNLLLVPAMSHCYKSETQNRDPQVINTVL